MHGEQHRPEKQENKKRERKKRENRKALMKNGTKAETREKISTKDIPQRKIFFLIPKPLLEKVSLRLECRSI